VIFIQQNRLVSAKEISKVFLSKEDRLLGISSGGEAINCSCKFYPYGIVKFKIL